MKTSKALIFSVAFVLLFVISSTAQTAVTNEFFDPSGGYHPVRPPHGSPDKFLHLGMRIKRSKGKTVLFGEVRGVGAWYKFSTSPFNSKRVRFITDAIDNVRYHFDGDFLGSGNFSRQWSGSELVFLKGRLSKYVGGKKAWQIDTPFAYYPPH